MVGETLGMRPAKRAAAAPQRAIAHWLLALCALIFAMVEEIVERRKLSNARFAAAIEAFGEPATVELIGFIGFYIMIAVLLTSFDVEAPDGAPNPLPA